MPPLAFGVKRAGFILLVIVAGAGALCAQTESEARALGKIREARKAGNNELALSAANEVIKRAPGLLQAYEDRAHILAETDDVAAARKDIDYVIDHGSLSITARMLRARLRLRVFDYEGVLADLPPEKARGEESGTLRGEALMALGRYGEALEIYTYLMSGPFGPNMNSRMPRAICLLGVGEPAEALGWFRAECSDNGAVEARRMLILTLCMLGQREAAMQAVADWQAVADKPAPEDSYDKWVWEKLHAERDESVYLAGVVRFSAEDFAGAAQILGDIKTSESWGDRARLLRHIALARMKQADDDFKKTTLKDPWALALARYVTGMESSSGIKPLITVPPDRVEQRRRSCEYSFYGGQLRLMANDREAAPLFFTMALSSGAVDSPEFALAAGEWKALQPPASAK
jgi:tetratricopeptide (TPR) repeat protein